MKFKSRIVYAAKLVDVCETVKLHLGLLLSIGKILFEQLRKDTFRNRIFSMKLIQKVKGLTANATGYKDRNYKE